VKEINLGYFPRSIVEILPNVISLSIVEEQRANKLIIQCNVVNFVLFSLEEEKEENEEKDGMEEEEEEEEEEREEEEEEEEEKEEEEEEEEE